MKNGQTYWQRVVLPTLKVLITLTVIIGGFLLLAKSQYDEEKARKFTWVKAEINNLRVDDDAEYHVTFTYENGDTESDNDLKDYVVIKRSHSVYSPTIYVKFEEVDYGDGKHLEKAQYQRPEYRIYLPWDYEIKTMNDGI